MTDTPGVRAVVLAATRPAFSAGHDLSEMVDRDPAFYEELFTAAVQGTASHRPCTGRGDTMSQPTETLANLESEAFLSA